MYFQGKKLLSKLSPTSEKAPLYKEPPYRVEPLSEGCLCRKPNRKAQKMFPLRKTGSKFSVSIHSSSVRLAFVAQSDVSIGHQEVTCSIPAFLSELQNTMPSQGLHCC